MAISAQWGRAADYADYFGQVDYQQNLSRGYDAQQILDYLNQNLNKLRGPDVPGGGGVYDMAARDAATLRLARERQAAQQNQVSQFESQIAQQRQQFSQQFAQQQQAFQSRLQQQQQQFAQQQQILQQQLAERQQQAEQAQRQLMIGLQQKEKQPTEVRMAASGAEKQGLTRRGTSGYFGRRGMRIGSLNVPNTGMAISPNTNQSNMAGSFA